MKTIILVALLFIASQAINPNYDPAYARQVLQYGKISYCEAHQIEAWTCPDCEDKYKLSNLVVLDNSHVDSQAIMGVRHDQETIIIAFRGSQSSENWKKNANFFKSHYPACHRCGVHRGFWQTWKAQKESVMTELEALLKKFPHYKVVVTGHSLGGTQAVFAALAAVEAGYEVDHLITFGQPRVGNSRFATYTNQHFPYAQRLTHLRDPVPHVPYKKWGFLQQPTEIWYNDRKDATKYKVCMTRGVSEDANCSDSQQNKQPLDHIHYLGVYTGCGRFIGRAQQVRDEASLVYLMNYNQQFQQNKQYMDEQDSEGLTESEMEEDNYDIEY